MGIDGCGRQGHRRVFSHRAPGQDVSGGICPHHDPDQQGSDFQYGIALISYLSGLSCATGHRSGRQTGEFTERGHRQRAGATFVNGKLIERPDDQSPGTSHPSDPRGGDRRSQPKILIHRLLTITHGKFTGAFDEVFAGNDVRVIKSPVWSPRAGAVCGNTAPRVPRPSADPRRTAPPEDPGRV